MLKYADYDVVFQEVPGEVSLAINISGCPNACPGCHSQYLMQDIGWELSQKNLDSLLLKYGQAVTCVAFMGGDREPSGVQELARYVHRAYGLKTAWYSGKQDLPMGFDPECFNFVKLGPYIEDLGGLANRYTNQRFYRINKGVLEDCTSLFWKRDENDL